MNILPAGALEGLNTAWLVLAVAGTFVILLPGLLFLLLMPNRGEMLRKHGLFVASVALTGLLVIPLVGIGFSSLLQSKPATAKSAQETTSSTKPSGAPAVVESPKPAPAATQTPAAPSPTKAAAPTKADPPAATPTATAKAAAAGVAVNEKSIAAGKALFQRERCISCHSVAGSGGSVGPDLTNLATRRTANWVMEHFRDPQGVSPGTLMPKFNLPDQDFEALMSYLFSLAQR